MTDTRHLGRRGQPGWPRQVVGGHSFYDNTEGVPDGVVSIYLLPGSPRPCRGINIFSPEDFIMMATAAGGGKSPLRSAAHRK